MSNFWWWFGGAVLVAWTIYSVYLVKRSNRLWETIYAETRIESDREQVFDGANAQDGMVTIDGVNEYFVIAVTEEGIYLRNQQNGDMLLDRDRIKSVSLLSNKKNKAEVDFEIGGELISCEMTWSRAFQALLQPKQRDIVC